MGFFNSTSKEAKKCEKQANIDRWNTHIRKCAQKNRIAQIKHLEDYLQFPSFDKNIVMAKMICQERDDGTNVTREAYIVWYDKFGFKINNISFPLDLDEIKRVFLKIIPFFIAINDDYDRSWWLQREKWNHGSTYDCDDSYNGKVSKH